MRSKTPIDWRQRTIRLSRDEDAVLVQAAEERKLKPAEMMRQIIQKYLFNLP